LRKKYTSAEAVAFINALEHIKTNEEPPDGANHPDVAAIKKDVTDWYNRRAYDNFRLLDTLRFNQKAFFDRAQNYFYDARYQAFRERLTGTRIYHGREPPLQPEPAVHPFATEEEAYKALHQGGFPEGLLTDDEKQEFIKKYEFYVDQAAEAIQVRMVEVGVGGSIVFDKKTGQIEKFDLVDNFIN